MSLAEEEKWQGTEIAKARALPLNMLRRREATVTAVSAAGIAPRTVTLAFDAGTTAVPGVRVPGWYWPVVGDEVFTVKHRGDDLIVATLSGQDVDPYIAPTLLNGWIAYAGFEVPGYYRDAAGRVRGRGMLRDGTKTAGTVLFTFPAGYRPATTTVRDAINSTTPVSRVRVDIATNGDVSLNATITGTWLSLTDLTFHAFA